MSSMNDSAFELLIIVGSVFTIAGVWFLMFPPRKINSIYGYRTRRSMQNADTWKEANRFSAKLLIGAGLGNACLGILLFYFDEETTISIIPGLIIIITTSFLLIILTEMHLNKKFRQ